MKTKAKSKAKMPTRIATALVAYHRKHHSEEVLDRMHVVLESVVQAVPRRPQDIVPLSVTGFMLYIERADGTYGLETRGALNPEQAAGALQLRTLQGVMARFGHVFAKKEEAK